MIRYTCPTCAAVLSAPDADAGTQARCPHCRAGFVIPGDAPLPVARPSRRPRDDDDDDDDRPRRRRRSRRDDDYDEPEECKKVPAALLALLLGSFGAHKFYLGYPAAGAVMLVLWAASFFTGLFCLVPLAGCVAVKVIALAEGILYLTKSDRDFIRTYQRGHREWF